MNDKKIFKNQENNLYVSFAMKKGERRESLLKRREELYKLSQKMTVYATIKMKIISMKKKISLIK